MHERSTHVTPSADDIAATLRPTHTSEGSPDDPLSPGTVGRWVAGHPLVLIYANVPALILPTLHPKIAHVLSEKDRALNGTEALLTLQDSARRLISTYEMVIGIVFAGPEGDDVAHGLHELHRPVAGKYPDGSAYHAWNSDVWNWTWGSILKGMIDIGDQFRLFRSAAEREEAYRGMNELGRRFGVRSLPGTLAEFDVFWQDIVDHTLEMNPQVQFIVDHAMTLAKPRGWERVPTWLWRIVSLPVARTLRVGVLAGVPEQFHAQMGLRETAFDRVERRAHGAFWRLVPRSVSGRFAPVYFSLRRRFGRPGWRTLYSRDTLQRQRGAADEARREARRPQSPLV